MKSPSDYNELLEMAGAKVLAYESFGSYQGDWIAKVEYNGHIGYIKDYYGSCSGCDALLGELGYGEDVPEERVFRLAKDYLDNILTYEEVLKQVSENVSWDLEADSMVKWVKDNQ